MQLIYNQESNPNSMVSPHSLHRISPRDSAERSTSSAATVTPCGPGTTIEQWMARCNHQRKTDKKHTNPQVHISHMERTEVSRAVYGILRDNLSPALALTTSQKDLTLIADSIENRLHQTASSPRAYCKLSTLEFRITALATAVLIHSDDGQSHNHQGISDTCARLSAAARRSLVYCVMVLVSYETRNLDKSKGMRMTHKNEGYLQQYQGNRSTSKRMAKKGHSQRATSEYNLRQPENYNFRGEPDCVAVLDDSNHLQLLPPSA